MFGADIVDCNISVALPPTLVSRLRAATLRRVDETHGESACLQNVLNIVNRELRSLLGQGL